MSLPSQYQWIEKLDQLPRTIQEALKLYGTLEKAGAGNNPTILSWAKELGLQNAYSQDSIPWCGLFAGIVAKRADKAIPNNPLWARNWADFGVKADKASLGDILVFVRDGGGHVGYYVAEDATAYHVLGGNQSDKVCITRVLKSRCIAVRRPIYNSQPTSVKPYKVASSGKISTNEA